MTDFKTVEFFGLCGAGKTTFLEQLPRFLSPQGRELLCHQFNAPVGRSASLHSYSILLQTAVRSPVDTFRLLAFDSGGLSLFQKIGYRLAGLAGNQKSGTRVLVDSGVIQPLITYLVEDQKGEYPLPIAALLAALPIPRLAVYFAVSPETAMNRYVKREAQDLARPRRRNYDGEDFIERFNKGFILCETLADSLQKHNVRLIKVDLSHDFRECDFVSLAEEIDAII